MNSPFFVSVFKTPPLTQPVWWIDPVNGSDTNSGIDRAHALKTFGEYVGRTGLRRPVANPVDIFITSSLDPADTLLVTGVITGAAGFLRIHGVPTVLHSGTISAFQTFSQATNTPIQVSDGTLDWSPFVGRQIAFTSGPAAGARGNILKAVAPGSARIDWVTTPNGTLDPSYLIPNPGDAYEVHEIPQASQVDEDLGGVFIADGLAHVLVELLDLSPAFPTIGILGYAGSVYQYMLFGSVLTYGVADQFVGCLVATGLDCIEGSLALSASSFLNAVLSVGASTFVSCAGAIFQSSQAGVAAGGVLESHGLGTGIGVFDSDSWLTFGQGEAGSFVVEGTLWGQNNTTFLVNITSGSSLLSDNAYTAKFPARCVPGTNEFQVNGKTELYANARTFPFALMAPPVQTTFANLVTTVGAGGFEGLAYDPLSPTTGIFTQGT